jgi:hypothetical protein
METRSSRRKLTWLGSLAAVSVAFSCGSPASSTGFPDASMVDAGVGSSGQEGTACTAEGALVCGQNLEGTAGNVVLYCSGGVFQSVFRCPGSEACANVAGHDQIRCGGAQGTYFAEEGAACSNESNQACSFDQRLVLRCSQGAWVTAIHCPPSTCANLAQSSSGCTGTWCANCGYAPGDMCSFAAEAVRCSTDLSKIVQCSDGMVTVWRDCGPGLCTSVESNGTTTLECQ